VANTGALRVERVAFCPLGVVRFAFYGSRKIKSFRPNQTEKLFHDEVVPAFRAFERPARRKLLLLHRAKDLGDLAALPGNRLELLKGDRAGQHSIRINQQWRICFVWREGDAYEVEIVDDH